MINLLFCIKIVVWCVTTDASTTSSLAAPTEGGRLASALQQTQHIANNANSNNQTFAEALLALYKNADYVRHGETISFKTQDAIDSKSAFRLIPNPAQDVVLLQLTEPTTEANTVLIYDLQGHLVTTLKEVYVGTPINVQYLQTGIYYCKLLGNNAIEKLVIIR